MMKTGPSSFRDATGVEWRVLGPSTVCGPQYADCWTDDSVAYLRAAGIAVPARPEPEPLVVHCKRKPYDVYVGRPGPWGNPYSHDPEASAEHTVSMREEAVDHYERWLKQRIRDGESGLVEALAALDGKVLGCWCAPQRCHGEVIARAASWAAATLAG